MSSAIDFVYHVCQNAGKTLLKVSSQVMVRPDQPDPAYGVYGISVAAELSGVAVQSLRLFENRGLLKPDRTDGGTRRYSANDIGQARHINQLLDTGVNLTGIAAILVLEAANAELRAEIDHLHSTYHADPGPSEAASPGRRRRR